jgi:DNA-binding NtrC family response regulator
MPSRRVLVAEPDPELRARLVGAVRSAGGVATEARTEYEALSLLAVSPNVLILDLDISPERRWVLLDAANAASPTPVRIALASDILPEDAFRLAQRGVRALFQKPFSLAALSSEIERSSREWVDLAPLLPDAVGVKPLHEVQARVREVMVRQALAISRGNRGSAARLLGISRQALHQALRRSGPTAGGRGRFSSTGV